MSSGGHNIKSTSDKIAAGTYRKGRDEKRMENHVEPVLKVPAAPLDFDKVHAAIWANVCELLFRHSLLTDHDFDAVRLYCELWVLRRAALADIRKNGLTYKTDTGHIRPNPNVDLLMKFNGSLLALLDRFGFNPKARQSLKIGDVGREVDPLDQFDN